MIGADWNLIENFYKKFHQEKGREEGDSNGVSCLKCNVKVKKIETNHHSSTEKTMRGSLTRFWYEWTFKCPQCGEIGVEKETDEDTESYKSPYS